MKKPGLVLKVAAIANAVLLVAAFVGCPSQRGGVLPHIAPNPGVIPHIAPPPPDILPHIAPVRGDFQRLLPTDEHAPARTADPGNGQRAP
jgi:hypothetical protein